MSSSNKVVLITGGASGIGAATALIFTKQGANVIIVDKNKQRLEETSLYSEELRKPYAIEADLTKDEEIKNAVQETIKVFGKIDVLVNSAGILRKGLILNNLMETYDELMNTNLRSTVVMTVACAPYLVETKGCIVNVSSSASVTVPAQYYAIYSLSKTGVDHFTRCAASQLAAEGVRVNAVNPGPVKTNLYANAGTPLPWNIIGQAPPLKKVSDPEEVAELIVFLASDKAKSITGSCYLIDNGLSLGRA